MKECPKCNCQCGDDLKICRTCGAILAAAAQEPPQPPAIDDPSLPDEAEPLDADSIKRPPWKCPACGKSVPGDFEVCWNCGANQEGAPDPDFTREPSLGDDDQPGEEETPGQAATAAQPAHPCRRCGSSKMIPGTKILDPGLYSSGQLQVVVDAEPDAMVFKNRLFDRVTADICGECGHVELKVEHPGELYEHYLQSKDGQNV
jgi:hypothetical protein